MYKHMVSRVVLKGWATGNTRRTVGVLDLDTLDLRTRRISRVGGMRGVRLPRPDPTERVWDEEVEKRLPHVIEQLTGPDALRDAAMVGTLKNCIAMHFARSLSTVELIERRRREAVGPVSGRVLDARSIMRALSGFEVVAVDEVSLARARPRRRR